MSVKKFIIITRKISSHSKIVIGSENDLDYDNKIKSEVKPYFSNLKNCRVKNINKSKYNDNFEYTVITFYIDGTESSKYGIVWKNNSQEFYTAENKLDENWYSYFIGYT